MLEAGFRSIDTGKGFPVFLHPDTGEEYALARLESKTGPGHQGFEFDTQASVSLEQDLQRRDLSINALAKDASGELLDPYGGQTDLKQRVLRHVSPAFADDPLRVFRVARFAAQLPEFALHDSTAELMHAMRDQLHELFGARVWHEWVKALDAPAPARFYETVQQTGVGDYWFAQLDLNKLMEEHRNRALSRNAGFVVVGATHPEATITRFFDRLDAPHKASRIAHRSLLFGPVLRNFRSCSPEAILDFLESANALHLNPQVDDFLAAYNEAYAIDLPFIQSVRKQLQGVKLEGVEGPELGKAVRNARLNLASKLVSDAEDP